MINTFTAIDFETSNPKSWSICQIGLVRVKHGKIEKELSILVQPPDNEYWSNFVRIHGITAECTANALLFCDVWPQIETYIVNQHVVAHNGFSFDFRCLKQTLEYYGIETPNYHKHCTFKIYKTNLKALCNEYNIQLQHHDALSDAKACAELFLIHLKENNQYGE